MRVIVLGVVVRYPLGGMAWHHLQYVLGLARLGHDVYFVEDSGDWPECYDPTTLAVTSEPGYGLRFATDAFARLGLAERWAYHDAHSGRWLGPCADQIESLCAEAELVLNLSGVNPLRGWVRDAPARALVDTDPAFTQIRHLTRSDRRALADQHTAFLTFAENVGSGLARIPDDGLPWQPTRQPVVLDAWPVGPIPADGRWTTVMQWDSYRTLSYGGVEYGLKCHTFPPYLDLPARVGDRFELAIDRLPPEEQERLERHGWRLRHPYGPTKDPWTYQRYIQRSRAEFTVAKGGHVVARSGWFSERSANYLASGRPVVTQETGFSDWLPTGAGLLAFRTPEEAASAVEAVERDVARHGRAGRELAAAYFDSRIVLPRLLEAALRPRPAGAP